MPWHEPPDLHRKLHLRQQKHPLHGTFILSYLWKHCHVDRRPQPAHPAGLHVRDVQNPWPKRPRSAFRVSVLPVSVITITTGKLHQHSTQLPQSQHLSTDHLLPTKRLVVKHQRLIHSPLHAKKTFFRTLGQLGHGVSRIVSQPEVCGRISIWVISRKSTLTVGGSYTVRTGIAATNDQNPLAFGIDFGSPSMGKPAKGHGFAELQKFEGKM